jgi:hypothetical protein
MTRAFRCAVCGGGEFRRVCTPRPDGTSKETILYECAGCSVVFLDVTAFNANEAGPPKSRGARLPGTASSSANSNTYGASVSNSAPVTPLRDK